MVDTEDDPCTCILLTIDAGCPSHGDKEARAADPVSLRDYVDEVLGGENRPTTFILYHRSWAGITHGASHYYGDIHDYTYLLTLSVERILTAAEARQLTADEPDAPPYREGQTTTRFSSREAVTEQAVKMFHQFSIPGEVLMTKMQMLTDKQPLAVAVQVVPA